MMFNERMKNLSNRQLAVRFADVGDGLCLSINDSRCASLVQVDCGSMQGARFAAERWAEHIAPFLPAYGLTTLVLSHYHADHYNGWVWAANPQNGFPRLTSLREVYSPGLPDPPSTLPLVRANLAFAAYVLGTESGLMEVDFGQAAARLAGNPIRHRRLFAGDFLHLNDTLPVAVLWPPRTLSSDSRRSITETVSEFTKLIEAPKRRALKTLYDQAVELIDEDSLSDDSVYEPMPLGECHRNVANPRDRITADRELIRINHKLRVAANHLGLAFSIGADLLFLGDLDRAALKKVAGALSDRRQLRFKHVVAPHHGTVWAEGLSRIHGRNVCISVGRRLWRHVVPDIRLLGESHYMTYLQGHLTLR